MGLGRGLGVGGRGPTAARLGASLSGPPATIAQTAYGAERSPTSEDYKGLKSWHLAVAVPVISVGWLCFIRWSLPK